GESHQLQLVLVLDRTAAGSDGRGADRVERRSSLRDAVAEHEPDGFLDPEASRGQTSIAQASRDEIVRVLVFLPGEHGRTRIERPGLDLLTGAITLEGRTNDEWCAARREHEGQQSLTHAPLDTGEIVEGRPPCQNDRVDRARVHER